VASWPRTIIPFEVSALDMPGPLVSKAQSGRVNIRTTQQIGRTWTEHYLVNVRSVDGRALLATIDNYWRNGTIFTIDHRDHLTPLGTGGGSPLVNAATQLVANPENFGAWTADSTPSLTAGQSDPFGGTAAYLIEDNNAAATEGVHSTVTFTGDATKAFSVFMKAGTSDDSAFGIFDTTAGAWRHLVKVTWVAGVPTIATAAGAAGSGALYTPELVDGWYRLSASAVGVVAANTNNFYLRVTQENAVDVGTTYFFGANAWNEVSPARYAGPSQAAGTTGSSLYLNGGTASVSNWLRAGDILSLAAIAPVYEVTADVSTQANGYVVVPINPPIFSSGPADNAAVLITGVTLTACILEPPTLPSTSGTSADYGEAVVRFSESL